MADQQSETILPKENSSNADILISPILNWNYIFKKSFQRFPKGLYLSLLISRFVPTVYESVRMFYLLELPEDSGVNIASQLVGIQLLIEIVQETLILPIYNLIGICKNSVEMKNRIKVGVIITFLIHLVICASIYGLAEFLVKAMVQKEVAIHQTVTYIRLELLILPLEGVNQFVLVILTVFKLQKHLYVLLVLRLVVTLATDTFFLNTASYSLKLGVNGIAYSNLINTFVRFVYGITIMLFHLRYNVADFLQFKNYNFYWLKNWLKIGFYSGVDSLCRNLFYALCVLRMMNFIEKQGIYWSANSFIWNWLLLAFLPLSDVLKSDTSVVKSKCIDHKVKLLAYFVICSCIGVVWLVSIPTWKFILKHVLNVHFTDLQQTFQLVLLLCPFYMTFMLNNLLASVLYGKGKTGLLAIQSILVNCLVYLPMFVLFLLGVYQPNLINIAALFGTALAFGTIVRFFIYIKFSKSVQFMI